MYYYYTNVVSPASTQHLDLYRDQILATYNDICGGLTDPCACLSIIYQSNAFIAPYDRYFCDALCNLKGNFASPPYTYPIRVTYKLPGLDQETYNNIIKLRPPQN